MSKTLQGFAARDLLANGFTEGKPLKACRVFHRPKTPNVYLGSRGSVRIGATRTASVPASPREKRALGIK